MLRTTVGTLLVCMCWRGPLRRLGVSWGQSWATWVISQGFLGQAASTRTAVSLAISCAFWTVWNLYRSLPLPEHGAAPPSLSNHSDS